MKAELSAEDALRLNVLLAGEVHAVRIDEGSMTLFALTPRGEARVSLNRNCRPELYAARVRELLGGHALGSPGGYPVHLRRWTRLGQAYPKNLEAMLKLGEPEAVIAVTLAPTITDEIARRAWWALPTPQTARDMLAHAAVRAGAMAGVLTAYLIEHLPFEEDPIQAMHSIRAVLGAGQLDAAAARDLWAKAGRRPHYFIGFLEHRPDDLPDDPAAGSVRPLPGEVAAAAAAGDAWAMLFARICSPAGQCFLHAVERVMEKPPAHEAVYLLFDIVGRYFAAARCAPALPGFGREAAAMVALAHLSNETAAPILTRTTAVGPLMRRHLEPLFQPLLGHIRVLREIGQ